LPMSRLGDYELLLELGRGGMGIVYRARQSSLDRIVALKLMHRSLSEDREHAARFLREARVAASLRHPGIVAIYDLGRLEGVPFFTMELIEGSSRRAARRWSGRAGARRGTRDDRGPEHRLRARARRRAPRSQAVE